jgi:hypothetical protein|tara:strand:+ start:419 stop:580 length:162 start_codon:yes stop_codon:yes gene_type:complete
MLNLIKLHLVFTIAWLAPFSFADAYDRKDFNYRSYKPNTAIGFILAKPAALST